jgi:hypothetical protein
MGSIVPPSQAKQSRLRVKNIKTNTTKTYSKTFYCLSFLPNFHNEASGRQMAEPFQFSSFPSYTIAQKFKKNKNL